MNTAEFNQLSNLLAQAENALDEAYAAIKRADQDYALTGYQLNTLSNQLYALEDRVTQRRRAVQEMSRQADVRLAADPELPALVERISHSLTPREHRTTAELIELMGEDNFNKLVSAARLSLWDGDIWSWRPPEAEAPERGCGWRKNSDGTYSPA